VLAEAGDAVEHADRSTWRMPPLASLTAPSISTGRKVAMSGMWTYLVISMAVVVLYIVQLATGR